jgi:hypothetical protein
MTSERAAALADEFAAANAEVMAFAASCTEEQWRTLVPGEGWTVGVVVHHIAEGHAQGLRWLQAMAQGDAVVDTQEDIDAHNVEHAARVAEIGVPETVALLGQNGAQLESFIRQLTDADLERTAPFGPAGGQPFPVAQLAPVNAGHVRGHLAHAREALGSDSGDF